MGPTSIFGRFIFQSTLTVQCDLFNTGLALQSKFHRNRSIFGWFMRLCHPLSMLLDHCTMHMVERGDKTYFDFLTFLGSFEHADIEKFGFFHFGQVLRSKIGFKKFWIDRFWDMVALLCSKIWHFCMVGVQPQLWAALCHQLFLTLLYLRKKVWEVDLLEFTGTWWNYASLVHCLLSKQGPFYTDSWLS